MKKLIAGALFSSLAIVACNPTPIPDSFVRFVNTIPDSSGVKIFFAQDLISGETPIPFKAAFPSVTTFRAEKPSSLTYSLCPADLLDCPTVVKNKTVNLVSNVQTTVFLIGTKLTTDDLGTDARPLEILSLTSETAAPSVGKARIRVLHGLPNLDAKKLDLYITAPGAALSGFPPELLYKNVFDYRDLTAGSYQIRATAPAVTDTILVDSGTLALEAGKTYTAVLVKPDVNKLGVVLLTDK